MPKKTRKPGTLFLRNREPFEDFIQVMAENHIPAQELGRGLIEAAKAFYQEHGEFRFPVAIVPLRPAKRWAPPPGMTFAQARLSGVPFVELAAAEAPQAAYAVPTKIDHLANAAAAERALAAPPRNKATRSRAKH